MMKCVVCNCWVIVEKRLEGKEEGFLGNELKTEGEVALL
jgi:hypothetical protein